MRYVKNNDVFQEVIDGEIILYNKETNKIVTLNSTAARIWNFLEGKSFNELEKMFMEQFCFSNDSECEEAKKDLEMVLCQLINSKCVTSIGDKEKD